MWAYVDETGNTGNRIFDPDQPYFVTAAMMTKTNFDINFASSVWAISQSVGVSTLHARELGMGLACSPEVRPRMSFESGYFQPLEWRRGHGTKGTNDRGDHRGLA